MSRERHLQDRGGLGLQQQVDVFQLKLHGAAGGQEHHGGERVAGGSGGRFHVWRRQGLVAGGLVEAAALGRAGSLWLRWPAGLGVDAGAAGPHVHHVDGAAGPARRGVQRRQVRGRGRSACSAGLWSAALSSRPAGYTLDVNYI